MNLNAPTQVVYIIALIIAIIGLLAALGVIGPLAAYAFWIMTIAYVILAGGCLVRGA